MQNNHDQQIFVISKPPMLARFEGIAEDYLRIKSKEIIEGTAKITANFILNYPICNG
jgi:hypothetical protein